VTGHALCLLEMSFLEDCLMEERSRGAGATGHALCLLEMSFLEDCLMEERSRGAGTTGHAEGAAHCLPACLESWETKGVCTWACALLWLQQLQQAHRLT